MKKILISLLCLTVSFTAVKAQDKNVAPAVLPTSGPANQNRVLPQTPPAPVAAPAVDPKAGIFKFKEETHDFGTVVEGPQAECDFEFKNVGKSPIIISEAHGSCGCTVPKWPTEPILPKHKGIIHVTYNTTGRVGNISKDVFITSNAQQSPMKLHITGTVKAKKVEITQAPAPPPPPPAPTPATNK